MALNNEIKLEQVNSDNKSVIDNVWQFYELESSWYSKHDVNAQGRFNSLDGFLQRVGCEDAFEWGFIVKYYANIAGLLIIGDEHIKGRPIREFSDIYILPKYRGLGIATHLINTIILNSDNPWLICILRNDLKAINFWRTTFARLPFYSVYENIPPEIEDLHEFIVNDREGFFSS